MTNKSLWPVLWLLVMTGAVKSEEDRRIMPYYPDFPRSRVESFSGTAAMGDELKIQEKLMICLNSPPIYPNLPTTYTKFSDFLYQFSSGILDHWNGNLESRLELLQSAWFPSLTGSTSLLVPKNPSFTQVVIRVMPQETEESPVILKVLATIIGDNGNEMVMGWTLRFPTTMQAEQFIHRCQSFIESLASITTYQQSAANAPSASTNIFLLYTSPYHLRKLVLAGKLGRTHDPRALSLVRLIQYIQAHGTLFIGPEQIAPWKTFIAQSIQTFTTDVDPRFYTQIQGMLAQVLPTYAMLGAKICEGVFFPAQLRYFGEYPNGPLVILDQTDRNRLKIFIALIRMHIKELKIAVKRNRLDQFHYPAIALQEITIPTPDAVMALPIPEWKKKKIIELLAQIPTPRQGEPFLDLTGRFHFEKLPPQLALPDEGGLKCLPFRASNS